MTFALLYIDPGLLLPEHFLWFSYLLTPLFHISQVSSTILKLPKQMPDNREPPLFQALKRARRSIFLGKVPKPIFSDLKDVQLSLGTWQKQRQTFLWAGTPPVCKEPNIFCIALDSQCTGIRSKQERKKKKRPLLCIFKLKHLKNQTTWEFSDAQTEKNKCAI